jgi:hypothetical protein
VVVGGTAVLQGRRGLAALVALVIDPALERDLDLEPFAQGVDARDADAVETGRDLVGLVVELRARVEHRHHDLNGRLPDLRVYLHRDAAAVVGHRDAVVGVQADVYLVASARQRFVYAVGHHLLDEVMEAPLRRIADVHGRPQADVLHPAQDADVFGFVSTARRTINCHTVLPVHLLSGRPTPCPV